MSERVSVVIPTIDQPDELRECFVCLVEQDYEDFDVLVVDSGSGVNQRVVDEFAGQLDARMVSTDKNGLPRARNYAVSMLEDIEVVAFCDPDARPVPGWISALVAEYDTGVGAVGGPVLDPSASLQPRETVGMIRSNGEIVSNFDADRRTTVQHLRGTNMSFDVDVLRELGGFDPAYRGTAHFEDTDATYKVFRADYDVVYTPDAALEHHHPKDDRDLEAYYHFMLANWPVLFEKTGASFGDRMSFHARRVVRTAYYRTKVMMSG